VRNGGQIQMPQGVLLDDLVWLRRTCFMTGADIPGDLAASIERTIHQLGRRIFGRMILTSVLEELSTERIKLPPCGIPSVADFENPFYLHALETWDDRDDGVIQRRSQVADPDHVAVINNCAPLLSRAQEYVCRKIANGGIFIEANPTSNLATGGVGEMSTHPIFAILRYTDGKARISINTDDPGVFATRIDQEFAVVLSSMINDLKWPRADALEALDGMREAGVESTFLVRGDHRHCAD